MINNPHIGIIGGTGMMGSLFADIFRRHGYQVTIASRHTEISIEDCVKKSDVVIISVPINVTLDIIKQLAPLMTKDKLLMDITSLKTEQVKAMCDFSNCSVLGTHPVFGPGVKRIKNQTMVLCPGRGSEWQEWFVKILQKEEAKIKICTPEEHDTMMAVIQALIHFSTISVAHVLKELGIDIRESLDFSSPIYKLRMDMIGRILNQSPRLYADIEIMNPQSKNVIEKYLQSAHRLFSSIEEKNVDSFIEYFKEASDYFGDFKNEATEYSNYVIASLVDK